METLGDELLAKLGYLVMEFLGGGSFAVRGTAPVWLRRLSRLEGRTELHVLELIDAFPFLETALTNLEQEWSTADEIVRDLGEWLEILVDGRELHVRAGVTIVKGRRLLLLHPLDEQMVDLIRKYRKPTGNINNVLGS